MKKSNLQIGKWYEVDGDYYLLEEIEYCQWTNDEDCKGCPGTKYFKGFDGYVCDDGGNFDFNQVGFDHDPTEKKVGNMESDKSNFVLGKYYLVDGEYRMLEKIEYCKWTNNEDCKRCPGHKYFEGLDEYICDDGRFDFNQTGLDSPPPKVKKLTVKRAFYIAWKMWEWLSENPDCEKRDWPDLQKYLDEYGLDIFYVNCPLCEYFIKDGSDCKECHNTCKNFKTLDNSGYAGIYCYLPWHDWDEGKNRSINAKLLATEFQRVYLELDEKGE